MRPGSEVYSVEKNGKASACTVTGSESKIDRRASVTRSIGGCEVGRFYTRCVLSDKGFPLILIRTRGLIGNSRSILNPIPISITA